MASETKCLECNRGTLRPQRVELAGYRNGEEFIVQVDGLCCTQCGFKTIDNTQSSEFTMAVSDAYRAAHGLLTGAEIRSRRRHLQMSQHQFAKHLGVGTASVKRWERGLVQEGAMDELIRLKTDPTAAQQNLNAIKERLAEDQGQLTAVFCDEHIELSFSADQSFSPQATIRQDLSDLDRYSPCSFEPCEELVA